MTTDIDKLLADTLDEFRRGTRIDENTYACDDRLVALAEVLLATRRELAEARRLVDALAGGKVEHGPVEFHNSAPPRCYDCGNDRWLVLGHRFCTRCQERDDLRAALREAVDLAEGYYCDAYGGDCMEAADRATFDRLRKVAGGL